MTINRTIVLNIATIFRNKMEELMRGQGLTLDYIDQLNSEEYDANTCHTHDYFDANEIMLEAMTEALGRKPCICGDNAIATEVEMFNTAWKIAFPH